MFEWLEISVKLEIGLGSINKIAAFSLFIDHL
jgi:hypothetical protein